MDQPAQPVIETPPTPPTNPEPPPPAPSAPQYEFTEQQNEVMKDLEWKLGAVGSVVVLASIAVGIVITQEMIRGTFPLNHWYGFAGIAAAVLGLAHGIWLWSAAEGFQKIHKTRGQDIDHLMTALTNVSRLFSLAAYSAAAFFVWAIVRFFVSIFA